MIKSDLMCLARALLDGTEFGLLIPVAHFSKQIYPGLGIPFLLGVREKEPFFSSQRYHILSINSFMRFR